MMILLACGDLKPTKRFAVNSGNERYAIGDDMEAIGLPAMAAMLAGL